MRISRVSYGYTKNMGNFESRRVDAEVDLYENEDPDAALELAAAFVHEALGLKLSQQEQLLLDALRGNVAVTVDETK